MGRSSRYDKDGLSKGAWTAHEDQILVGYVTEHGEGRWGKLSRETGLKRCGKSCRLRWLNYLRPDIKRGNITEDEEELINRLHKLLGNRWKLIAGRLPGRTDNEIKNYWNSISRKKAHENQPERCKNERTTINELSAEGVPLLKAELTPTSCIDDGYLDTTSDGFLPVNGESDMMTLNFIRDLNAGKLGISEFLHTDFSKLSEFATTIVDSTNGCRSRSSMSTSYAESPLYLQEWLNDWAADNSFLPEAARGP